MKAAFLMSGGPLVAPFAQAHEQYGPKSKAFKLLLDMCHRGDAFLYNAARDLGDFLEDRQRLYRTRREKYPIYFGTRSSISSLVFTRSHRLNTTKYITGLLSDVVNEKPLINIISGAEATRIKLQRDFIRSQLVDEGMAATYTLYETSVIEPKPNEVKFFVEISTRLFIEHYTSVTDAISMTGIYNDPQLESYDHFPFFDLPINCELFKAIGVTSILEDQDFHIPLFSLVAGSDFSDFSKLRLNFLKALNLKLARVSSSSSLERLHYTAFIRSVYFNSSTISIEYNSASASLASRMRTLIKNACVKDISFAEEYNKVDGISLSDKSIVVFTATDIEDQIARESFLYHGYDFIESIIAGGVAANRYDKAGMPTMYHVRTSAGSTGLSGSQRISENALKQINPVRAIACGICFGVDATKQKVGDVAVSERIALYEPAAVREGNFEFRGDKIPTDPTLIGLARASRASITHFNIHVGPILSGDKLVDDHEFRQKIISFEAKAVAGEMEAAGLVISCMATAVPLTIIKGIADFATNKDKDTQHLAASNAFELMFRMVENIKG